MSRDTRERLDALTERAARRSMTITSTATGWQLASPFRVVVHGSLDDVGAWLTAAEQRNNTPRLLDTTGGRADS
ncbi:hypothetical protein [Nocardia asteroides]|uniref:hypothetical protein n=1 Tax=Nocardia asteroides TaxID=1824 RepID=UPI003441F0E7